MFRRIVHPYALVLREFCQCAFRLRPVGLGHLGRVDFREAHAGPNAICTAEDNAVTIRDVDDDSVELGTFGEAGLRVCSASEDAIGNAERAECNTRE